ncbi:MAG: Zn-dependent M16 (insulinase) family peptidase, partial [Halioglobus sp.]
MGDRTMTCEALQMDVEGQRYKDFVLKKLTEIKGLKCTLRELEHEPSGALVLHVANDDDENVFCLSFRTLPDSSNGVAHILEHTVLCGSEKFPVNDPFFSMNRRSLNTFMNALTGSDFTCYPAASQVKKDFYNLLDVYLDAVFKPKLKELSFLQEGHRLGFSDPEDANSQLQYKGVVFNEMKGALSSPDSRVWKELRKHLIPDLTYGIDSGGDPKEIPELTYQQLLDFHGKFYHPSRCLFFFYGNIPLNDHLDFISSNALKGVEKQVSIDPIPLQKRFTAPKKVSDTYPASADQSKDKDSYISLAWLTCHILEQRDVLGLTVLDIILTSTDASPLRYALLQSGLCKQVDGILEDDISEVPYALLMKGCDSESADKLQDLVFDTLQNVLKNGIPVDQVEAAIHQIELYRREISGDSYPFGLNLFMRSALLQQHGGNAEDGMSVDALFEDLRQSVEDPNFLTGLLRKYFLENPHFVLLTMAPDENLAVKENQEERTKLDEIQSKLTEDDKKKIIDNSRSLSDMQEEDEDIEVLPKVTLKDVPLEGKDFTLTQEKIGNIEIFHHGCFTNGLVYADVVFALPEVKKEDLSYLRLFTHLLPQVGSGDRDYKQNLDYILEHTGGLGVSLSLNSQIQDFNQFKPCVTLGGKALHRKVDKLFPLLCDMISSADFTDVARLKELILKHQTGLQSSLNRRAMRYA